MSNYYPYRKYSRYPLERRSYRWRMNHDAWCWLLVLAMIAVFVVLELWR
jgi:hypothetical protein